MPVSLCSLGIPMQHSGQCGSVMTWCIALAQVGSCSSNDGWSGSKPPTRWFETLDVVDPSPHDGNKSRQPQAVVTSKKRDRLTERDHLQRGSNDQPIVHL